MLLWSLPTNASVFRNPVKAQQKCLAHLRRHFKKVVKLGLVFNPALGQAFLDLIDQAFAQHRQWRETGDEESYQIWALEFKTRIEQSLQQWTAQAGYEAGKLLPDFSQAP